MLDVLRQNGVHSHSVIIAPDRFTASVERGLITSLNIQSTFDIEVMSFTRLATRLIGGEINKCLTPEGSVMLIRRVIDSLADKLVYYGKVAKCEGFENELYAALTALRNSGVEPSRLVERTDGALKRKAQDIALIYDGYLAALSESFSDSSTRLMALAKHILEHPECVATTNFYITDIYDFSAPELAILEALCKNALSLTIGIACGYDNPNRRIYPDRMLQRLIALSPDRVERIDSREELEAPIEAISTQLFSYLSSDRIAENNGKVTLRRCKNRQEEVTRLALDVLDKVMAGGRYKDIEVFASDISDYETEIKAVFSRYGIPFFIDKRELLSEQTKVRFLTCAIDAVRSGFRKRSVLDFVKNPLFMSIAGEDEVFKFENYVLKYSIDYTRFSSPFALAEEPRRDEEKENVIPEAVRIKMMDVLSPILPLADGEHTVSDTVAMVKKLLDSIDPQWQLHVGKVATLSEYYQKCAEQVDEKILSVLDEMDSVLDGEIKLDTFGSMLSAMLRTLKISLVPTFLDCVFVGDIDSRYMGAGDIYILGATNDKLPAPATGGAVLTLADEEILDRAGIRLNPNGRSKVLTNMYAVCDLMKKPHGRLIVSYPETGNGGKLMPSVMIDELKAMLYEDGKPIEIESVDMDGISDTDALAPAMLSTPEGCYFVALKNSYLDGKISGSAYSLTDDRSRGKLDRIGVVPERIALLDRQKPSATSISRLETFYKCPYMHYFTYMLALKKRKEGEMEGTETGTIFHYMLEKLFKGIRDGRITCKEQIPSLAEVFFEDAIRENRYEPLLSKPGTARQLKRVRKEAIGVLCDLYDIYLRSSFKPMLLEAKLGEDIGGFELDVDGKKIAMSGVIDRVDMLDDKFIIIDYKSFRSADIAFDDLYYGKKLQLYIYMRAVQLGEQKRPVGVFYLPIFAGFTDDSVSRYKLKGQVCADKDVLLAIDSNALTDPEGSVAPYKLFRKAPHPEVYLEEKDFDTLGDYAVGLATKGAEEIISGYIKPTAIKDQCGYCDFAKICAYKEKFVREFGDVSKSSFVIDENEEESEE